MRLLRTYTEFSTAFARRATYCVRVSTALRVSDLCARSDLCVQRTALRLSDLLRMIQYGFARNDSCARGGLCGQGTAFARKRLKLEGLTVRFCG